MPKTTAAQLKFGYFQASTGGRGGLRYVSVGHRDARGRWYVNGKLSLGIPDDAGAGDAARRGGDILTAVCAADAPSFTGDPRGPVRLVSIRPDLLGVCAPPDVMRTLPGAVANGGDADDAARWLVGFATAAVAPPSSAPVFPLAERPRRRTIAAAAGDFFPQFLLRSAGGRSGPIRVGRFRDLAGRWHDAAEKTVEFRPEGNLCLIKTARRGTVRDLASGETEVNGRPVPACDALHNLEVFRAMSDGVHHVLRVLHFEVRGPSLVTYSPWCRAGSLREEIDRGRFTPAERAGILSGAWEGLRWLHSEAGLLHYDIKPANVFVDCRSGAWSGVLGDIDDAVPIDRCVAGGADIKSTPSYGAPLAHGDPRRDQVALLLTTAEVLGGVDWYQLCVRALCAGRLTDGERALWGYATDGTGTPRRWKRWIHGVYQQYAAALPRVRPGVSALANLLALLDAADDWTDYAAVRRVVDATLSGLTAPPPTAVTEPVPEAPTERSPKRMRQAPAL